MADSEKIGSAFRRVAAALGQRLALGHGTGVSRTRIMNGLTCEIREGNWSFAADMPEQAGGNGTGAAFDGGPVAMAYSRFSDVIKDRVRAEYLESIAPYKTGDGYEVPGEFVVARGLRE